MEKQVEINGKTFVVKELMYSDVISLSSTDTAESAKQLMLKSVGLTEEEFNNLSMKEGVILQKEINELNGLGEDFQKPPVK